MLHILLCLLFRKIGSRVRAKYFVWLLHYACDYILPVCIVPLGARLRFLVMFYVLVVGLLKQNAYSERNEWTIKYVFFRIVSCSFSTKSTEKLDEMNGLDMTSII